MRGGALQRTAVDCFSEPLPGPDCVDAAGNTGNEHNQRACEEKKLLCHFLDILCFMKQTHMKQNKVMGIKSTCSSPGVARRRWSPAGDAIFILSFSNKNI